ncbi:uncharacterized protein LOC132618842 isoform X1 [Lycium barbarum]|uniref:uncharacterized protein LOC132618842 isoform X1 n=1 Tax=Lycium barbarum TaxID=112863 RepID=UPI00293E2290|nr:uncharacterized protein LOC132618842 isoform X1 [Lycium barbarum]
MAILFQSSSSSILSLKIFLISTTVLSAAIMLKISAPAVTDFAVSEVPSIWKGVVSWLKPPYLYLVINCIIITIVASSKLQNNLDDDNSSPVVSPENLAQFHPIKDVSPVTEYYSPVMNDLNGLALKNQVVESSPMVYEYPAAGVYDAKVEKVPEVNPYDDVDVRILENDYQEPNEVVVEKDVDVLISKSYRAPVMRQDSIDYSSERPPASARFSHRKYGKSTPEGGKAALRVTKPKRQDTLESTWKTITEGRAMPLTRHLRKSDTWETHGGRNPVVTPPQQKMKKSETFNDHTTPDSPLLTPSPGGSGKLKKEPSLSQDELNRRVEAFIKKFNEDMRLQRQQSLQQYTEMINRGSH